MKAGIFMQHGPAWISDLFLVGHFLLMGFARLRRTQVTDPARPRVDDHEILVRMRLLLAAVVERLFFGVFRGFSASVAASQSHQ